MKGVGGSSILPRDRYALLDNLLVAVAYIFATFLSWWLNPLPGQIAPIWLASGIAVGVALRRGAHVWLGVLAGAFLVNYWAAYLTGPTPILFAAINGMTSLAEVVVAYGLLEGGLTRKPEFQLDSLQAASRFIQIGGVITGTVSATLGIGAYLVSNTMTWAAAPQAWFTWFTGAAVAILLIAPLFIAPTNLVTLSSGTALEALVILCLGVELLDITWITHLPIQDLVLLLVVWAALRLPPRWAYFVTLALSFALLAQVAFGYASFIHGSEYQGLMLIQTLLCAMSVTTLWLVAVVTETKKAQQGAESVSQAKSAFLANMSHEIRTPLNAILGYAQILRRDRELAPAAREGIAAIESSGRHLLELINEVLDLAKIEAGRMELQNVDFDLAALVNEIGRMFAFRCKEQGLEWQVQFQPPADGRALVHGDERKLRQVLINLLANAVKFTEAGEVRLGVARTTDSSYRFEVTDTGVGIAAADRKLILEPFRQGAAAASGQGTGLGLAITSRQIELMGGTLAIESTLGAGSCFTVTVPLPTAQRIPGVEALADLNDVRLPAGHAPLALVVDDVHDNRAVLSKVLTDVGCRILEANDGAQAVEMVLAHRPDIVWMDVRMPVMDGPEAAKRIWAALGSASPRIVAVSASTLEHEKSTYLATGFDAFVAKPYLIEDVYACLADLLHVELEGCPAAKATFKDTIHLSRQLVVELMSAIKIGDIARIWQLGTGNKLLIGLCFSA